MSWTIRGSIPGIENNHFFFPNVQTGSGAHATSDSMVTGASFPEVKRPGIENYHSPASMAEVKNWPNYTSNPPDGPGIEFRWQRGDFQYPARPALWAHLASCTLGIGGKAAEAWR
jgi:hypothetical protein